MIGGGNAVVFNVHPGAKKVCAVCLQILHKTIVENGGPANLITMQRKPDMEAVNKLTASPKIRLMVGTGGMGMVNALLKSGKKTIGAGAGNPPVVVDDTADLDKAASVVELIENSIKQTLCFEIIKQNSNISDINTETITDIHNKADSMAQVINHSDLSHSKKFEFSQNMEKIQIYFPLNCGRRFSE